MWRCKPLPYPDGIFGYIAAAGLHRLGEIGKRITRLQFKRIPKVRICRRGFRGEAAFKIAGQLSGNSHPAAFMAGVYGASGRGGPSGQIAMGSLLPGLVVCMVASWFELWAKAEKRLARGGRWQELLEDVP